MTLDRRCFLSCSVAGISLALSNRFLGNTSEISWADVRDWGVEGKGFSDTEKWYDRLPQRAHGKVTDAVWNLSRHSAGMAAYFKTDANEIHVDYQVTSSNLAMPHMPATGVSGLDLYAKNERGKWQWVAVLPPKSQTTQSLLISGLTGGMKEFALYLPLYNGTEYLKVGVPNGKLFETVAPRANKPLVFYGTSITHGACASRPGMPHPSVLGRRLDLPIINLGFSGNGRMDIEVGEFLKELQAAAYIIDCLPNMTANEVSAKTDPLVRLLRANHPDTPILLIEDRSYSNSWIIPAQKQRNDTSRKALREQFDKLQQSGVDKLFYLDGESLLGEDRDDTTDGSHPSDLGFYRHANAMEPVLRKALGL
jgi:lysophospholipase L1-like esterase